MSVPINPPDQLHMPSRSPAWSQLFSLFGGQRVSLVVLMISSLLSGLAESGILAIVAQIALNLVGGSSGAQADIGALHIDVTTGELLALAFALALLRLGLQVPIAVLPARMAVNVQARLRSELFTAYTRASWPVQSREKGGHLQELVTEQVGAATEGALQVTVLLTALFAFLALVISALVLNVAAALIVLAGAIGLFVLLRPLSALGGRHAQALSQAAMDYAGAVNEAIRLAEETHVFGTTAAQRDRVNRFLAKIRTPFFRTQLLSRLVPGIYQSLIYLFIVGGLGGLYVVGSGQWAALGAVVLLLVRAGTYGQQAQGAYQALRQTLPYLTRLQKAKSRYDTGKPAAGGQQLDTIRTLAFEDVHFAYEASHPVLHGIDFRVSGGEAIGIVGPSGAGKSTLAQILLRLRTPDRGGYLVNDVPVEQFASEDWHARVAYVPQEPRLLHASVIDNIRFFRDVDDDAVQRAAQLAGIHDEIVTWREGYATIVGPRADAVSGGQQQRICLARALAAQPEVLVLDEPTSALDPHSELVIQQSLAKLKHQLTLFIVAHRMSTLDICERVMVVVDGRLEAFDTVSLLQKNSTYYRTAAALSVRSFTPNM